MRLRTLSHARAPPQVAASTDLLACARQAVELWGPLGQHPALVGLRGAVVEAEYDAGQPALCFVYDFHAGACVRVCA